ncbi:Putative oxidoreductase YteT [Paenibacillus sp. CECT 9249]|uniref:Gfo/Idh/MocA family protein n=1 Tax=Paenibacillus sp. CECT 9249 TaxID=2845385 RepID=UPI001E624B23|nr:Gfo/Idh/MocA family oxidoreductase [Paenibacillus sp. CECT 9249]CAH0119987.1 Putative oxidoreductase YteT [Paenibacillus sp. CECT 9249]
MKKVKVAVIGAGQRGEVYAGYAIGHPLEMEVVAVADPDRPRRMKFQEAHGIADDLCFDHWDSLLDRPQLADAVFICTQDQMHFDPTMKALAAGYHVLLEKPMSTTPDECVKMAGQGRKYDRIFSICHVLRYTPFFGTIKRLLDERKIGDLVSIQHNENVGYWHQAHSFVRGNWRKKADSSPMILAKSCHDLDILLWLAGGECTYLSSFGSLKHFTAENAPEGAPSRCLDGCPAAKSCAYYAPKIYLTDRVDWPTSTITNDVSYQGRLKALQEGPYGRCVYHCDNDVVDHQVVNMEFAGGITAAFTMSAFTNECGRTIKLMGTKGEIRGAMEKNEIEVTYFETGFTETISLHVQGGHVGHGGGDHRLVEDFLALVRGDGAGKALTTAATSLQSHMMAFAAEESRLTKQVIYMPEYMQQSAAISNSHIG